MERIAKHLAIVTVVGFAALLGLVGGAPGADVTYDRLLNADKEPQNWLTYYGNYRGWRYSALDQINTTNVKRLVVKWAFQTGPDENFQVTPLVVDGVMYLTNEKNHVFALDAATGKMLWRYSSYKLPDPGKMPIRIYGAGISRGVSLAKGKVLMGTLDAHLLALDAGTGKLLWEVQVGDYEEGQGFTSPPLIVKDKAVIGVLTSEFPTRGFIDAYDIETGKQVWRFRTIPGPGEPGNETWGGDSWRYGCGAASMPGTYDPELNLVYIGTAQPCPMLDGEVRPGDNLYTSTILALDPDTGKLNWYFQPNPHDLWNYEALDERILVDIEHQGRPVKALLQANKNGYFYALDRTSGRFLFAKPFVARINWTKGLDEKGRPIPGIVPTREGVVTCPSAWGAKNWNHTAYSPQTGYAYIPVIDMCMQTKLVRQKPRKGVLYLGGEGGFLGEGAHGLLEAIDVKTGDVRWRYRSRYPMLASVLATGGGLVFTGDPEGNALAFDASSGNRLWAFHTGSGHRGSPITYAVGGKQYLAVPSGWGGVAANFISQAFPELGDATRGSTLFVFGLFEE
jgi:alcohol dehydrogenase (cytochrome c)